MLLKGLYHNFTPLLFSYLTIAGYLYLALQQEWVRGLS